jgi:hypothetical protein
MPMFEVKLTAVCVCLVEADTQDQATEVAWQSADPGDFDLVEGTTSNELKDPDNIDSLRRHAELVLEA